MKLKWIAATVAAAAISLPAIPGVAQVTFGVRVGPPPIRYERRPPMPGEGYVWVDGFWRPQGNHYVWVAGHWDRPPYQGAYWAHPHYDHYNNGWVMHDGRWVREDYGGYNYDERGNYRGDGDRHDDHHDDHRDDHRDGDNRPH